MQELLSDVSSLKNNFKSLFVIFNARNKNKNHQYIG